MIRAFVLFVASGVALLTTSRAANAQREIGLGLSYDPRLPVGTLHDLVPGVAFAGIQGKWEYYAIPSRLALGVGLQYHYFQHGDEFTTVQIENGAVTAPFSRYAYFLTVLPTVRYFPFGRSWPTVRPYVELGAGVTSATGAVLASDLSRRSNEGGVVLQPSAGVLFAVYSRRSGPSPDTGDASWVARRSRESMFAIAASLAWAFTTADVMTARDVSYVGVQLGVYSKL